MRDDIVRNTPPEVDLEHCACPMGCPPGEGHVLRGWDRLHDLPGVFDIVRCNTCGLMRTDPRPTSDTIGYYYPDSYGPHQYSATQDNSGQKGSFLHRVLSQLVEFNTERIPPVKPGRLFEVGCGGGGFLRKMAKAGWQVEGLDFATVPVQRLCEEGYAVHCSSLEDFERPDVMPDIVVGWMVLEHLYDPLDSLRKIHSWLDNNGWLVLSVPNENVRAAWWAGDAWFNRQLPTHLQHFDINSLQNMLERADFQVHKVLHQRFMGSILETVAYVLNDHRQCPRLAQACRKAARSPLASYALYPLGWLFAAFGQTGRITVWARKK